MPRSRRLGVGVFAACLLGLAAVTAVVTDAPADEAGPQGAAAAEPATDGRLVLVSGRDDHGERAQTHVELTRRPDGHTAVGAVADGTFAQVTGRDGEWLRVTTVEGPPRNGWVNDFYLRGVVHVGGPPPHCRSRVAGRMLAAGEQAVVLDLRDGRAHVRTVRPPHADGWVARRFLAELPPQGRRCE